MIAIEFAVPLNPALSAKLLRAPSADELLQVQSLLMICPTPRQPSLSFSSGVRKCKNKRELHFPYTQRQIKLTPEYERSFRSTRYWLLSTDAP